MNPIAGYVTVMPDPDNTFSIKYLKKFISVYPSNIWWWDMLQTTQNDNHGPFWQLYSSSLGPIWEQKMYMAGVS